MRKPEELELEPDGRSLNGVVLSMLSAATITERERCEKIMRGVANALRKRGLPWQAALDGLAAIESGEEAK